MSEIFPPKVGGSGRWFSEIYRRMPPGQFQVAAGTDPRAPEAPPTQPDSGLKVHRVPLSFPTRYLRASSWTHYRLAIRQLSQIIREHNIERLHCARAVPEGLIGAYLGMRFSIPFACFAHGEEVNLSNAEPTPKRLQRSVYGSRELGLMVGVVASRAEFIIANSLNTKAILTDRWSLPTSKVEHLYPGVDSQRFLPSPSDSNLRQKLGWNGRIVILTVGRLQQRKGHDVLIRAVELLRKRWPEVLLVIVGQGEEEKALRARCSKLGLEQHVQFRTSVDDDQLVSCYQQCDVFVLANRDIGSDIEGFGMVLVEAQACARPVIAGDSGGTTETMEVGKTGFVVDCSTPEPLANALVPLLESKELRQQMGERGRQWVTSHFDWESLAKQARTLFERRGSA